MQEVTHGEPAAVLKMQEILEPVLHRWLVAQRSGVSHHSCFLRNYQYDWLLEVLPEQ